MSISLSITSGFSYKLVTSKPNASPYVFVIGSTSKSTRQKRVKQIIEDLAPDWQKAKLRSPESVAKPVLSFNAAGLEVILLQDLERFSAGHQGKMDESRYVHFRDSAASLFSSIKASSQVGIELIDVSSEVIRALIVGFELAQYQFVQKFKGEKNKNLEFHFFIGKKSGKEAAQAIEAGIIEAKAIQLARHLVNLPPNFVNPESIEQLVKKELDFSKSPKVSLEIWDHKRLDKENMHLHLAVGKGSLTPPRMIRIKYRPQKSSRQKPIAFVGKGITFDTGGLDIKPSAGMRLMKKDMGGAAAVLGIAFWAVHSNYQRSCDFYLALAENSVDAASMRPSDIYKSRAGYLVEIDNTDAEGRLVLADVMDVAVKQKGSDEPEFLVDIATLTGAIKVALGSEVAGLFCNDDKLASEIEKAGQQTGEFCWRMPLVKKYFSGLNSNFADFKNSADGFGGAITAALFLEKFCGNKKWAHLDIYAWSDKPAAPLMSTGGSGQSVQGLIQWLKTKAR